MTASRRLYLIRHGLPDYYPGKAVDEPPGPPLSYVGRSQIRQSAEALRSIDPLTIYASPLERTRESAEIVAAALDMSVTIDGDLSEWHRTERLYDVNERAARWLSSWLHRKESVAAVFGHASPLLSILRTALYLPHFGWWRADDRDSLILNTCDRFEFSMGAVYEIAFTKTQVVAQQLFCPEPRISHVDSRGAWVSEFPRPAMTGENRRVVRPNFSRLIGHNPPSIPPESSTNAPALCPEHP